MFGRSSLRHIPAIALLVFATGLHAQPNSTAPTHATDFRYGRYTAGSLATDRDAVRLAYADQLDTENKRARAPSDMASDALETPPDSFRLTSRDRDKRFSGIRRFGRQKKLGYSADYVPQMGATANAAGAAPTYWQMGNNFDIGDPSGTRTSYRRFTNTGITSTNDRALSVATGPKNGPVTIGATYSDFRPIADTRAISARDLRVSLGVAF